ncbi:MAG: DUF554 domain-containing protein [Clostridia bacterium]|nr:DUF554 domain-containing protein [Clostridia bacterium]MCL6521862.1 DUF554 domain-containing protein [Bacillota bacterium]
MIGTLVNVLAILAGTTLGAFALPPLPEAIHRRLLQAVGLAVIVIGLGQTLPAGQTLVALVSTVLGAAAGEAFHLHEGLDRFGEWLRRVTPSRLGGDSSGFVTATLIFVVGPMAILGALQDGLYGDHSTLFAKAALDGITSAVLAATLGASVGLAALVVLLYQGGIALFAAPFHALLTGAPEHALTATGGLLILAIGLNMVGATEIRVANLLPALPVALALGALGSLFHGLPL